MTTYSALELATQRHRELVAAAERRRATFATRRTDQRSSYGRRTARALRSWYAAGQL